MYFFTADEHYGHRNIIKYCNRPFESVEEMDEALIYLHNQVVSKGDIVIHAGDFSLIPAKEVVYRRYINRLNGIHKFLMGSHDYWLPKSTNHILEMMTEKQRIVVCHYAMHTWRWSHYGSWQLYGHSHGKLKLPWPRYDIGVDNNNFSPISFDQLKETMHEKEKELNSDK